jgi:protein SCO1/2
MDFFSAYPGIRKKVAFLATLALLLTFSETAAGQSADHEKHGAVHSEEPAQVHVHPEPSAQPEAEVGLEEHLGARIPLDLVFRDEAGQPVTLAELITMPTVIAPVYYDCPNVCSFLQAGMARSLPEVKLKAGEDFRVLSISFDETETPEKARRSKAIYMDAMRKQFPAGAWNFLTGDLESIRELLDAAGYRFFLTLERPVRGCPGSVGGSSPGRRHPQGSSLRPAPRLPKPSSKERGFRS